ncbi:hypothetical protein Rleg5DRAFT_5136 [Rhizobium leguminosarum bv. viciae WSM1455]|nr:hypothetical protein Rleg5DRAFT_5136 [Rhizobium leguminosarum bv. viciae WSM1455]
MRKWLYDRSAELIEGPLVFVLTLSVFTALASIVALVARVVLWFGYGHWYRSICDALIFLQKVKSACLEGDPDLGANLLLWLDPSLICLIFAVALIICAAAITALSVFPGWLAALNSKRVRRPKYQVCSGRLK